MVIGEGLVAWPFAEGDAPPCFIGSDGLQDVIGDKEDVVGGKHFDLLGDFVVAAFFHFQADGSVKMA